jgi:Putative cyclase
MLVDVSHVVEHGMVTYKGLPAPLVCDFLSREQSRSHYAPGTEFHIGKIEMVANTGTYLDSPFHRYANGKDLSELPLERLANLEGVVISVDLSKGRAVSRGDRANQYQLAGVGFPDGLWPGLGNLPEAFRPRSGRCRDHQPAVPVRRTVECCSRRGGAADPGNYWCGGSPTPAEDAHLVACRHRHRRVEGVGTVQTYLGGPGSSGLPLGER